MFAEISSSPAGQKYPPKSISDNDLTLPSPVKQAIESSHHMNAYFTKFLVSLLRLLRTDRTLLEDRGHLLLGMSNLINILNRQRYTFCQMKHHIFSIKI